MINADLKLYVASYFLCLDAKKVTKKNQGQSETLRAFVRSRHTFGSNRSFYCCSCFFII